MTPRRYTVLLPRVLDLRRSFAFNRRPGDRNNRGRVQAKIQASGAPVPDVTAPVFVDAVILASGTQLAVGYNETLDPASVPLPAAYALAGTPRTVTGVAVAGSFVLLTLSGAVAPGAVVTLSYTAGAAPVRDLAGNVAANLVAAPVTNNSAADLVAPTLVSATIPSSGTGLTLVYNEVLDAGSTPAPGAYALAGTAAVVTAVNVTGTSVILTLSPAVNAGAVVTVSYTAGGAPIQDVAGNDAANLAGQAVTNNSTAGGGDVTAPVLVSAAINAAGNGLVLTYSEALDAGSVPAVGAFALGGALLSAITGVGVAGSAVTLSLAPAVGLDEVGLTLSYTAGVGPIQDLAGNDAANLVAQAVSNAANTHAFSPADAPGLVGWVDVMDAAARTLTGGGTTCSDVTNKASGFVWDTPSSDIPFEPAGLNGKPCLHPTVIAHRIQALEPAVAAAGSNNTPYSLYFVVSYDTPDAVGTVFAFCVATAGNPRRRWGQSTSGLGRQITTFTNDAVVTVNLESAADNTSTAMQVVNWHSPGTVASCRVNGGAADPNAAPHDPGVLTPTRASLFAVADNSADTPVIARFGELLFYSVDHAAAVRSRINSYLMTKWA